MEAYAFDIEYPPTPSNIWEINAENKENNTQCVDLNLTNQKHSKRNNEETQKSVLMSCREGKTEEEDEVEEEEEDDDEDDDEEEEEEDKSRFQSAVENCLSSSQPLSVSFGGKASALPSSPGLFVFGVGIVPLPVVDEKTFEMVVSRGKISPHGAGRKSVVNGNVRSSTELEPSQFKFCHPEWDKCLRQLVNKQVGPSLLSGRESDMCNITFKPYKLLLYRKGGHFIFHVDTEKEKGMFATLVVQLPSLFKGGDFCVRLTKKGLMLDKVKEAVYDLGKKNNESMFHCFYAAHYADCEHKLEVVTEGFRFAVVYSLCWSTPAEAPRLNSSLKTLRKTAGTYNRLLKSDRIGKGKVAFFLNHDYTMDFILSLGVNCLKGEDRALLRIVQGINEIVTKPPASLLLERKLQAGLSIYLCLADVSYDCSDEYEDYSYGGYYNNRTPEAPDEFDSEDVTDGVNFSFSTVVNSSGKRDNGFIRSQFYFMDHHGPIDVFGLENGIFRNGTAESDGYYGNAPPTITNTYSTSMLLIVPNADIWSSLVKSKRFDDCLKIFKGMRVWPSETPKSHHPCDLVREYFKQLCELCSYVYRHKTFVEVIKGIEDKSGYFLKEYLAHLISPLALRASVTVETVTKEEYGQKRQEKVKSTVKIPFKVPISKEFCFSDFIKWGVEKYGWDEIGPLIVQLLTASLKHPDLSLKEFRIRQKIWDFVDVYNQSARNEIESLQSICEVMRTLAKKYDASIYLYYGWDVIFELFKASSRVTAFSQFAKEILRLTPFRQKNCVVNGFESLLSVLTNKNKENSLQNRREWVM